MAVGKEIRTKISSIRSTQDRMEVGKPYANRIRSVVGHLANANPEYQHLFMQEREVKRVGYIVVSTDRGLCGGLNINLFKATMKSMKSWDEQGIPIDLCLIGAKAAAFFGTYGGNIVAATRDLVMR